MRCKLRSLPHHIETRRSAGGILLGGASSRAGWTGTPSEHATDAWIHVETIDHAAPLLRITMAATSNLVCLKNTKPLAKHVEGELKPDGDKARYSGRVAVQGTFYVDPKFDRPMRPPQLASFLAFHCATISGPHRSQKSGTSCGTSTIQLPSRLRREAMRPSICCSISRR